MSEESTDNDLKLLQVLINEKLISAAQADLAKSDGEVSGMTIAEVLMARGWVKQETLDRVAPWLKEATATKSAAQTSSTTRTEAQAAKSGNGEADYEHNLLVYRQLMQKILDE